MELLEKYFRVKLDNQDNEGFSDLTIVELVKLNIMGALSKEEIKKFDGDVELAKKQNKVIQEHAISLLEKQLNERGRCLRCNGWLTSQYFEEKEKNQKKGGRKGGSSTSERKVLAAKQNAAKLNANMTPEKRAEIQKKRIATMAKKREERERLKKMIES